MSHSGSQPLAGRKLRLLGRGLNGRKILSPKRPQDMNEP